MVKTYKLRDLSILNNLKIDKKKNNKIESINSVIETEVPKKRKSNNNTEIPLYKNIAPKTLIDIKEETMNPSELKLLQRKIRNRISAQQHRDRQNAYIKGLEQSNQEKDRIISELKNEITILKQRIVEISKSSSDLEYGDDLYFPQLPPSDDLIACNIITSLNHNDHIHHRNNNNIDNDQNYINNYQYGNITTDDIMNVNNGDIDMFNSDTGSISDVDSSSMFSFEPSSDESDFLFSESNSPRFNSFIIFMIILIIPFMFFQARLANAGFGLSSNVIQNIVEVDDNNRFLSENKLTYFTGNENGICDASLPDKIKKLDTDITESLVTYKNRPIFRDEISLKHWINKLKDTLQQSANDVSDSLIDISLRTENRKMNSSYLMCPSGFGKTLLYNQTMIYKESESYNNTEIEKPFLMLLVPKNNIEVNDDKNIEIDTDKIEWLEICCSIVRSRIVKNIKI